MRKLIVERAHLVGKRWKRSLQFPGLKAEWASENSDCQFCRRLQRKTKMSRPRLSEAERHARKKARAAFSFSDQAYSHYDPETQGYGSADQWESIAEALFGKVRVTGIFTKYINLLGLDAMPEDLLHLTTAFRRAMFKAHPDHGGTNSAARDVLEAYQVLKNKFLSGEV